MAVAFVGDLVFTKLLGSEPFKSRFSVSHSLFQVSNRIPLKLRSRDLSVLYSTGDDRWSLRGLLRSSTGVRSISRSGKSVGHVVGFAAIPRGASGGIYK